MVKKKEKYSKQEVMKELGISNTSYHRWTQSGKLVVHPAQPAYVTHDDLLKAKKIKRDMDNQRKGAK